MRWLLTLALLEVALCGCSTALLLKQQRLELLNSEYDNLQATDGLLSSSPNPELLGQSSAFVSLGTVNKVLAAADNVSGPIPSVSGATFHIDSVRAAFSDGFPEVEVKAWAQKGDLKIKLTVSAVLEPYVPSADPSQMELRIHVLKVVPIVQWSIFHLRLWGFGQDLIHAKLQEYADQLPKFTIPLQSALAFSSPAKQQPIRSTSPDGYVDGVIQIPAFSYQGVLVVDRSLFLPDGIHVYLSIR